MIQMLNVFLIQRHQKHEQQRSDYGIDHHQQLPAIEYIIITGKVKKIHQHHLPDLKAPLQRKRSVVQARKAKQEIEQIISGARRQPEKPPVAPADHAQQQNQSQKIGNVERKPACRTTPFRFRKKIVCQHRPDD
ncbi:hypothetical protein SDC9_141349 [bioreactor metagenome]|uniref:Uncharacterized protein n=1 Tax=bioreactor metagenome TaxID=1076179 RepID=A0A645DXE5_9ZZZZ